MFLDVAFLDCIIASLGGEGGDAADFGNILIFSLSHIKTTDETERFVGFNGVQEGNIIKIRQLQLKSMLL